MAINERLIDTAVVSGDTGNQGEEGLILHLDANDVDSYDGDGTEWVDIKDHEYTPATNVSEHFNTVLYPGNGGTNEVTGVGFQPDLVWIKRRNGAGDLGVVDTLRGNNSALFTNSTSAESALTGGNISMDIDGFDINTYGSTWVNLSSGTYAAWCFKAGGAPSGSDTVSIDGTSYADEAAAGLTAGTIAVSGLSVNTDLGFSIVKYTGTTGADDVGHGLDVAPDLVIAKTLDSSDSNSNWIAYASPLSGQRGILNGTQSFSASTTHFRADPDSTVLKLSSDSSSNVNRSGDEHIAYCFASKRGVSKVGSYKGTGAAGNKVYTGFEPAWIIFKPTTGTSSWYILDVERDSFDDYLFANSNAEEGSLSLINTTSTGFELLGAGLNNSGVDIMYYAIAKDTNETSLIPDTDLELNLDAGDDDSTSSNWQDLSSNDYTATFTGITYDEELGNSYNFVGGSSEVLLNDGGSLTNNANFTVEMWLNSTDNSNGQEFWGSMNNAGGARQIYARIGSDDKIEITAYSTNNSSDYRQVKTTSVVGSKIYGKWTHLSIVMSSQKITEVYINGESEPITTLSGDSHLMHLTSTTNFGIGGWQNTGTGFSFNGDIGQVRMYHSALTQDQIRQNYNFTKPSYPNGYDGTISGATWNSGGYFDFDGSNDYVSIPSTATSPIDASVRNFTFSMWINRDSTGYAPLITKYGTNTNTRSWYFQTNASGQLQMGWWNGSSIIYKTATSAIANTANQWYHVALAVNASTMDFYVDGVLKNSLTGSVTHRGGGNEPIIIGSQASGNYNFFNGQISKVKIHDKALTGTEITALYNEGE